MMSDAATIVADTASSLSSPPNGTLTVVTFGTTGVGKSSIINMLPDNPEYTVERAFAKASVVGVTKKVKSFHKMVGGRPFTILDTMGTGEMNTGTVPTHLAIEGLYDHLVASSTPGIHLVLIVMKAGRMTALDECNYLLARYLFGDEVPIALVLTHMDSMDDKDTWWDEQENRGRLGLLKAVGVVSFIGTRNVLASLYNESKEDLSRFVATQLRCGPGFKLKGKPRVDHLTAALASLMGKHTEAARFHAAMLELLKNFDIADQHANPLASKMRVTAPLPVVIFVGAPGSGKSPIIEGLPSDKDAAADPRTRGDVQEWTKVVKGQRIRILETLGIPLPTSSNSTSVARAVRALYDAFMAHPLGIRLVVLVARVEGQELTPVDIMHYHLVKQLCRDRPPICLITIQANHNGSGSNLTIRNNDLAFQKHVPLPGQRQLDTIANAIASLVKSNVDSPIQPTSVPSLLASLPGYAGPKPSTDSRDLEGLEQVDSLLSSNERRRVLLYGAGGVGRTSVFNMFNNAPRAREFELIDNSFPGVELLHSGLALLVFVMSTVRLAHYDSNAYARLKDLSRGRIPICVVATHMDTLEDPEMWWKNSKQSFLEAGMDFDTAPTCVTAIHGPVVQWSSGKRAYDAQYKASILKLERLFVDNALSTPYSKPEAAREWFREEPKKVDLSIFSPSVDPPVNVPSGPRAPAAAPGSKSTNLFGRMVGTIVGRRNK